MPQLDPIQANDALRAVLKILYQSDSNYFRRANQNAPTGKVDVPFSTVLVTNFAPVGQDVSTYVDEDVPHQITENVEGQRHMTADVQFFRTNALRNANRLNALLRTTTAGSLFQQYGLGFIRAAAPLNLTTVVDTFYEERAQVELEFYVSSLETLLLPTIASVEITISTENQSVTREVNLDVDS